MSQPVLRDGGYVVIPSDAQYRLLEIPIRKVRLPDNHCAMDLGHVINLAGVLDEDDRTPPILVSRAGDDYWLIDGRHRYVTALVTGRDSILAVVAERVEVKRP